MTSTGERKRDGQALTIYPTGGAAREALAPDPYGRTMQRKPRCEVDVSTAWAIRAAGR